MIMKGCVQWNGSNQINPILTGSSCIRDHIATIIVFSILFYPIILEGRRGTTDDFAIFHLVLFPAALINLTKSIPVQSLTLPSNLFFCPPLLHIPLSVP